MASRTLFGVGAIGETIQNIQEALNKNGCDAKVDRVFGPNTVAAVKKFQGGKGIPASGDIDDVTWQALIQRPVPACNDRCLQLTATFEGHGYELAVGNFDGALLTWGIIGFTITSGEIQSIVQSINATHPELLDKAFDTHKSELLTMLAADRDFQKQWANERTTKTGGLSEPWRSLFSKFGSFSEVQAEQIRHVRDSYLQPAIVTAKKLKLTSELGLALCFDIHVQSGGIKPAALKSLQQQSSEVTSELQFRKIIANAVADSTRAAWKEDVRRRKLTIAIGQGTVHGHEFVLENWGLSGQFAASELAS